MLVEQYIENLYYKHATQFTDTRVVGIGGFTKAIQEVAEYARKHALDDAASLIRNAAQRAVDKEYHKTFALLLMLAGDIDKLKDTSDPSVYLTLINEGNIEQSSQPHTVSNARESYQYVVRRISESGESFTRKQVGLIESIAVAAEEMGYQRGTEQASQPQWIPVSERLPETLPVLATNGDKYYRADSISPFLPGEYRARFTHGRELLFATVTHWMPLPALPQSE